MMKLKTNLYRGKSLSIEEGLIRSQNIGDNSCQNEQRKNDAECERCVQFVKSILYLVLIFFVGWFGWISLSQILVPKSAPRVCVGDLPEDLLEWMNDRNVDSLSYPFNDPTTTTTSEDYIVQSSEEDNTNINTVLSPISTELVSDDANTITVLSPTSIKPVIAETVTSTVRIPTFTKSSIVETDPSTLQTPNPTEMVSDVTGLMDIETTTTNFSELDELDIDELKSMWLNLIKTAPFTRSEEGSLKTDFSAEQKFLHDSEMLTYPDLEFGMDSLSINRDFLNDPELWHLDYPFQDEPVYSDEDYVWDVTMRKKRHAKLLSVDSATDSNSLFKAMDANKIELGDKKTATSVENRINYIGRSKLEREKCRKWFEITRKRLAQMANQVLDGSSDATMSEAHRQIKKNIFLFALLTSFRVFPIRPSPVIDEDTTLNMKNSESSSTHSQHGNDLIPDYKNCIEVLRHLRDNGKSEDMNLQAYSSIELTTEFAGTTMSNCPIVDKALLQERLARLADFASLSSDLHLKYQQDFDTLNAILNATSTSEINTLHQQITGWIDRTDILIAITAMTKNTELELQKEGYALARDLLIESLLQTDTIHMTNKFFRDVEEVTPQLLYEYVSTLSGPLLRYVEIGNRRNANDPIEPVLGKFIYDGSSETESPAIRRLRHILNAQIKLYFLIFDRTDLSLICADASTKTGTESFDIPILIKKRSIAYQSQKIDGLGLPIPPRKNGICKHYSSPIHLSRNKLILNPYGY